MTIILHWAFEDQVYDWSTCAAKAKSPASGRRLELVDLHAPDTCHAVG